MSQRFLDTYARGGERVTKAEILHDGQVERVLAGESITQADGTMLSSVGGRVDVGRNTIRRSGTVEMVDLSGQVLYTEVRDLLTPMNAEIRPYAGLRYWDATATERAASAANPTGSGPGFDREYVPEATLVITTVEGRYPHLTVSGYDRMWWLSQFTWAYVINNLNIRDALIALITDQLPLGSVEINIPTTTDTTGVVVSDAQTEAASLAHELALGAGWALWVDPMGAFTADAEPAVTDNPTYTYAPGAASVADRPTRVVTTDNAINVVVTAGEASDLPVAVRGYWEDTDPDSVTYVGRVKRRPFFHSSPLYRTTAQANVGAATLGQRLAGLPDTVTVNVAPNLFHESGDVIWVTDPDQELDVPLVLDSFSVPLRAADGTQTLQTRSRVLR